MAICASEVVRAVDGETGGISEETHVRVVPTLVESQPKAGHSCRQGSGTHPWRFARVNGVTSRSVVTNRQRPVQAGDP